MPNRYRPNYPATVAEVLDDQMTFRPAALRAVRAFARSRPWQGTTAERIEKIRTLNQALAHAYRIPEPRLEFEGIESNTDSGRSSYRPWDHTITLRGRLSVVTYLHEFGHARGFDERQTCRWSINLFRRCFPRSWSRCRTDGHAVRRNCAYT